MKKSLSKAYLLWLIGGIFGLHLFYLRRHTQAIICLYTFGGFLVGLIHDAYQMPNYVKEANLDSDYVEELKYEIYESESPSWCMSSFINCLVSGSFFYYFLMNIIKHDRITDFRIHMFLELIFTLVEAQTVYFITTRAERKCHFKFPLIGACINLLFRLVQNSNDNLENGLYYPLFSTLLCHWKIEWDKDFIEKKRISEDIAFYKSLIFYIAFLVIFFILIYIFALNNGIIRDNQRFDLNVVLNDLFHINELIKLIEYLKFMRNFSATHGFWKLIDHLTYKDDYSNRENNAYEVNEFKF